MVDIQLKEQHRQYKSNKTYVEHEVKVYRRVLSGMDSPSDAHPNDWYKELKMMIVVMVTLLSESMISEIAEIENSRQFGEGSGQYRLLTPLVYK